MCSHKGQTYVVQYWFDDDDDNDGGSDNNDDHVEDIERGCRL